MMALKSVSRWDSCHVFAATTSVFFSTTSCVALYLFKALLEFFFQETFFVPEQPRLRDNTELRRRSSLQVLLFFLCPFWLPSIDRYIVVPVRLLFF